MICPKKYRDMTTGKGPSPQDRHRDMPDSPAGRLEAALDDCLVNTAMAMAASADLSRTMDAASPAPPLMQRLEKIKPQVACVFSPRLSWMRGWLGDRWTKRAIANLFREKVARRYLAGGWGECSVECGASSSKMIFRFDVRTKAEISLYLRGTTALADLGRMLGVERGAGRDQVSTVEYLEDLRLGVSLMRFDLEATRRESEDARWEDTFPDIDDDDDDDYDGDDYDGDDNGYYPPFEGSPGDDNFGV